MKLPVLVCVRKKTEGFLMETTKDQRTVQIFAGLIKTLACPVALGDVHHLIMPPKEKQNHQTGALLFRNKLVLACVL